MYLTYEEYKALGGTVAEPAFNGILPKAEIKVNYNTFNRLIGMNDSDYPRELKLLVKEVVDILAQSTNASAGVTSYSNGIESYSYASDAMLSVDKQISRIVFEYLSAYPDLLYRGVKL